MGHPAAEDEERDDSKHALEERDEEPAGERKRGEGVLERDLNSDRGCGVGERR